jgi:hypothetical protein
VEQNEGLLWKIYIFYSFNAGVIGDPYLKVQPVPIFRSAGKFDKRLLNQDDFWQMLCNFELVPSIIVNGRFNKLMSSLRVNLDAFKIKISFREFVKVLIKLADGAYPTAAQETRLQKLLTQMDQ